MRFLFLPLASAVLLACAGLEGPLPPLQGLWSADSIPAPLTPVSLVLTQHDTGVTGTGKAMGVDTPVPVSVTGTYVAPHVVLSFSISNGSGGTIEYTATLREARHMVGTVVFTGVFTTKGVQSYSLAFTKQ